MKKLNKQVVRTTKKPKWEKAKYLNQIIYGDCLEVMKELPDNSIDLILTDPPYGHKNNDDDLTARRELVFGKQKHCGPARPILNDGPEANDIFRKAIKEYARILKPGGNCCCCCAGGGGPDPQFARWSLWLAKELEFK